MNESKLLYYLEPLSAAHFKMAETADWISNIMSLIPTEMHNHVLIKAPLFCLVTI
jgi:hypothetical protein